LKKEQAKRIRNIFKNNHRKFPKYRENYAYRYRKSPGYQTDLIKIELPHNILSLKQQAQRIEKKY
jgi:hypothetical protein